MKILIATDAWDPQINGVVKTLKNTISNLKNLGLDVETINPTQYKSFRVPFTKDVYSPIHISKNNIKDKIEWADYVHVSTEGIIGLNVRNYCIGKNYKFSTAYHTDIPTFLEKNIKFVPLLSSISKFYIKWFHNKSSSVMATTKKNANILKSYGIKAPINIWSRGVDSDLFKPIKKEKSEKIKLVYCGRVSPEKGIDDFLRIKGNYQKTIIGDGITIDHYKKSFPDVNFTGFLHGEQLANELAKHDIFVFPSKFDTFGLVNIEAMSCGLPVACYDCKGPGEIVSNFIRIGSSHPNLLRAIQNCHHLIDNNNSREHVLKNYTWENATNQFLNNLTLKN